MGRSRTSTPGRTRTCDRRFRKPLLYPPELRARRTFDERSSRPEGRDGSIDLVPFLWMRPAGFEPAACGLGNRRSIHLSYERFFIRV